MAFERTLVQIRERTFLEVLDLALVVLHDRPLALGLAALAGIAPLAGGNAWLCRDPEFPLPLFALLVFLEAPWATAPLTIVLGALMFDQRLRSGQVLWRMVQAFPALLLYQLALRLFLAVSVFLGWLIPARLLFLNEVILLERVRWWKVPGRCSELCARRGGDLFGQWLAQLFFGAVFIACAWLGTGTVISALTTSEMTWEVPGWGDVYSLRFQVLLWLVLVFFAVARFLTYLDHRIRKEGWEIQLRLEDASRALEEAEGWRE
jgi:hypothetical protein